MDLNCLPRSVVTVYRSFTKSWNPAVKEGSCNTFRGDISDEDYFGPLCKTVKTCENICISIRKWK